MDAHDYNKWMGMPKFKVWIVEVSGQPTIMQIKYGHNDSTDVVNVCFAIGDTPEDLADQVQDALNTLLKSFYLPKKGIDHVGI